MDGFDLGQAQVAALINAASGKTDQGALRQLIERQLAPICGSLRWYDIPKGTHPGATAEQAIADGYDVVLAIGGDGTQAAVAQAVADSDVIMAPIPTGTFNYFARDLGLGATADEALAALRRAKPRAIDVAEVNGTIFLNNASFGLYPEILERRENLYRRWGRSRIGAYWTVLTSLFNLRRRMRLRLSSDSGERQFKTRLAFVAASPLQLETLGLDGAEALRRGQLALYVAHGQTPWALVGAAVRLAMGKACRIDDFDLVCADELTLETRPPERRIAHDGEKSRMIGPFRLRIRRGALRVLAPLTRPDGTPARGADNMDRPV